MLVGRKREREVLDGLLHSGRSEFVAVYGRRRVGKTYLVRQYFKDGFAFCATGAASGRTRDQLRIFGDALREHGDPGRAAPADWFEAFSRLRALLESGSARRDRASGRLVVFLDELPWFDTARSGFRTALEHFWNGWASAREDIMLVVCGSATSWIITNLVNDRGGFHNRLTRQIRLMPFTLGECEEYFRAADVPLTRRQVVESYMVFGGVPYYLDLVDRRMSLAQNVEQLCFDESGPLRRELGALLASLFKNPGRHEAIVRALARGRRGMTRAELAELPGIGGGQPLTKALAELEQCGFVRRYRDYARREEGQHYMLTDPFTLFSLRFLDGSNLGSWMSHLGSPSHRAWSGLAFESVCLAHVPQIKAALGISGIETSESAWRSRGGEPGGLPGAQIDLLIDRRDGVVNVCEMRFTDGSFAIDAACERSLRGKLEAFSREAAPRKALHLTMVTMQGVARNAHSGVVTNEVIADDLFA